MSPFLLGILGVSLTVFLRVDPVSAEWKFQGAPKTRNEQILSQEETEALSARPKRSTRIQVFGSGRVKPVRTADSEGRIVPDEPIVDEPMNAPNDSAASYAEMLKADSARLRAVDRGVGDEETAREFESVRSRLRSRRVAEAGEPAPAATSAPRPTRRAKPPVEMETEVITPQKAGKGAPTLPPESVESAPIRSGEVNPAFGYTHLLPGPFNLPQGAWVLGSSVAYGVLDFLEVSTNLARTVRQHWNFRAKVPMIEYPTFVASAFVDYESYNPRNIDDTNPDMRLNRWQPGVVTGYEVAPDMAFFLGGNFNFGEDPVPVVTTSGYLHGAQVEADWSWLYNPSSSRLGNNAISAGVKYDLTYSLVGFGLTHHWRSFELGLHYTWADRDRFLPIIAFGYAGSF